MSSQFINDTNTIEFNGYELIDVGASCTRGRMQYALNLTSVTNRHGESGVWLDNARPDEGRSIYLWLAGGTMPFMRAYTTICP